MGIMLKKRPKLIIADDHRLVAEACKKLLEAEYDIVATVDNGRALVEAATSLKPQVLIIDIGMPLLNGLEAGRQIKHALPGIKFVYLTMTEDADLAAEAFRGGASAYLLKTGAANELMVAVKEALNDRSYLSPAIAKDTIDFLLQNRTLVNEGHLLTGRQREVLQLLAEGKSMKEVGSVLNMKTRTVAFHKYRIMEVLHAKSSAELVQYAVRNQVVALQDYPC
jgi:DNA-binding NarL/FixJ family response regulator